MPIDAPEPCCTVEELLSIQEPFNCEIRFIYPHILFEDWYNCRWLKTRIHPVHADIYEAQIEFRHRYSKSPWRRFFLYFKGFGESESEYDKTTTHSLEGVLMRSKLPQNEWEVIRPSSFLLRMDWETRYYYDKLKSRRTLNSVDSNDTTELETKS